MSSSRPPASLELWVFHDNGSRQGVLEAGMEVLLETVLPRGGDPGAPKTTFVLRGEVLGAMETSAAHEQKGRFTMVLGALKGYLLPGSASVRMRTNGDLQEWCYPDDGSVAADELVAWLCASEESIAIIFSPVRSDTGRWYPRKKNEGSGFRSLPAMFRSSGVGYMKLGDINTSRFGNQFLSFDQCRTFCNEGGDVVLRRLGLPTDAVARCRVAPERSVATTVNAGRDERPIAGTGDAVRTERAIGASIGGGDSVDPFGGRNRNTRTRMAGLDGTARGRGVQPLDTSVPPRGDDLPEGKYSPRSYEEKYSPRGEQDQVPFDAQQQQHASASAGTSSGASSSSSSSSGGRNAYPRNDGGDGGRGASPVDEQGLRAVLGPPPTLNGAAVSTDDGVAVVSRSTLNNIISLKTTLDGNATEAAPSSLQANASGGHQGSHKQVQVRQYKPPTGKPKVKGHRQAGSSSRARLQNQNREQGGKVPEAALRRAGRHKRASTPAEQKRADAQEFQSLMDFMKGEAKYFEGCDRGTTEYNMKIQRLVRVFEEWKVDGRKRSLMDMAQPMLEEHQQSAARRGPRDDARDEAAADAEGRDSGAARARGNDRRAGRGGIVVQLDGDGGAGGGGMATPKSPQEIQQERKSYNEMFQAFLAHARSRGFFDGCEKGTPEYNLKIQQCIAKFEELKAKNL